MAEITVSSLGGEGYQVEVGGGGSRTSHQVRVPAADLARFGGGASAEDLLVASFHFLLEREPKEAILRRFEISVIARYFPEYPAEIRRRLAG